jgi:hypothetical protein
MMTRKIEIFGHLSFAVPLNTLEILHDCPGNEPGPPRWESASIWARHGQSLVLVLLWDADLWSRMATSDDRNGLLRAVIDTAARGCGRLAWQIATPPAQ